LPPADAWDAYVRTVAKNFGHRLEFLEIWNEPDLKGFFEPPVEEYIELCRRAVKIAREVSPKVKIASGGFATMHPGWWDGKPARFHEEVMAATKGCFDIHSYHEHGYFPHYQQMVDNHFIPMRQRLGIEIPWIASETAMHSAKGTDAKQADCLFKKLLFTWARGGKSYTWYGLFDNGYDLEYSEHNFGTIDHFMEPKHVYATYAAIVRLFVEASFQRQITSEGSPWLFAFTAPDSALLAHWNAVSTTGTSIYAAMPEGTMAKASTFDLAGNEKTLLCLDESALFTITETGQVVKLYGAKGFRDVQPVAMLEIPAAMTSEEPVDGTLILRNPVSRQVRCTLSPDISKGAFFRACLQIASFHRSRFFGYRLRFNAVASRLLYGLACRLMASRRLSTSKNRLHLPRFARELRFANEARTLRWTMSRKSKTSSSSTLNQPSAHGSRQPTCQRRFGWVAKTRRCTSGRR
jgi:hypothetical protein